MLTFLEDTEEARAAPKEVCEKQDEESSKTVKKNTRLKYIPGPIGALIDQAEHVGLQLTINQKDELEFRRSGRAPIPLAKWGKNAWAKEIKQHINADLLKELHEAVKPSYDEGGQELMPRRKDMVGFPPMVDRHATMALLNKNIRRPRKGGVESAKRPNR